jgi:preprotein translocase subunit SecD
MTNRSYGFLFAILLLVAAVIWIDLPGNPGIHVGTFDKSFATQLGLDLRGGLQVLLEVDQPADVQVTAQQLNDARQILENRSNALGVGEVSFQTAGTRRIVAEFPGLTDTTQVINVLKQTGQLEFVDFGTTQVADGTVVQTDLGQSGTVVPSTTGTPSTGGTLTPGVTPTTSGAAAATTPQAGASPTATPVKVWHTIMTGGQLDESKIAVTTGQTGGYVISFALKDTGAKVFSDYTTNHVHQYLGIVLDKKVISAPVVNQPITDGAGIIEGGFTAQSANDLAIQLRYGSLPIPLKIAQSQTVDATLGSDSINKSMRAGIIGLLVVILFMALYYRVPGVVADVALMIYTATTFALFKLIPVTLTLPGIAAFILTIGVAVDANILIFERLKEELRAGRTLRQAIDLAWQRAWPSIRDSNLSTIITAVILFWFGSAFGASIVKGFALTLFLGVCVSLFTAVVVSRTLLHLVLDNLKFTEHPRWFGA